MFQSLADMFNSNFCCDIADYSYQIPLILQSVTSGIVPSPNDELLKYFPIGSDSAAALHCFKPTLNVLIETEKLKSNTPSKMFVVLLL